MHKHQNRSITDKVLLNLGIVTGILFWASTILCGSVHGNYNHISGTISELGAIGTRSQRHFSFFLSIISLLGIGFFTGLYRTCTKLQISMIPVLPVLVFFLANICIALFPLGNEFHPLAGQVSIAVILGPVLVLTMWRKKILFQIRYLSFFALSIFIISLLLVLTEWIPDDVKQSHQGLLQRIFHTGWSFWFVSLSLSFNHLKHPVK